MDGHRPRRARNTGSEARLPRWSLALPGLEHIPHQDLLDNVRNDLCLLECTGNCR